MLETQLKQVLSSQNKLFMSLLVRKYFRGRSQSFGQLSEEFPSWPRFPLKLLDFIAAFVTYNLSLDILQKWKFCRKFENRRSES